MKVKLLYPPRLNTVDIHQHMPRLGISMIYSTLKSNNVYAEQDDLAIRCLMTKNLNRSKINLNIFNDEDRIKKYLEGKHDSYLESVIQKILNLTRYDGFDIFGFSITDISQYFVSLCLAKRLKEIYKGYDKRIYIAFGGPSITLKNEYTLKNYNFVDFEVVGDGEISFLLLVKGLEKKNLNLSEIPNLVYKEQGVIRTNKMIDISSGLIPAPDFEGLPIQLYKNNEILIIPYSFTRGCIAKCAFCTHRALSKLLRVKDAKTAIKEIKELSKKYNSRCFMFCENSFNISNKFVSEICKRIIEEDLGIKWMTWARPDQLTEGIIREMHKAGCIKLDFGIESGSQNVLDLIGKGFKAEDAERVIRTASKEGIWVHGSFIVNFLNENDADFQKTIDFINRNAQFFDSIEVNIFSLNQGSIISKETNKYGIEKVEYSQGPSLGISYSLKDLDEYSVNKIGSHRQAVLRQIIFKNKISKLIDPTDIFEGYIRHDNKDEAKRYLIKKRKYPILI